MLGKYSVSNVALNLNDKEEFLKLQPPFIAQVTEEIVMVKAVSGENIKFVWRYIYISFTRYTKPCGIAFFVWWYIVFFEFVVAQIP